MFDTRKVLGLSFALSILLGAPAFAHGVDPTTKPPASLGETAPPESYNALADRLNLALGEERWDDALADLKSIAAHPDFSHANDQARLATFYLTGVLNLELDRPGAAVAPLVTATGMAGATIDHWYARLDAESQTADWNAAAITLTRIVQLFPDELEQMNPSYLVQRASNPDLGKTEAYGLRAALLDAGWSHPAESGVWMLHIDELLARGEVDRARAVVDRVTDPSAVIQLYALHRYDTLSADLPPLDIDTLMAEALAEDRLNAAAPDADMAAYSGLAGTLFAQGQLIEAVATADAALALPEPEADSEAARDRLWIMDTRARSLMALGRADEAVTQMQAATAVPEGGSVNVSQTINLSWFYLRLDRNTEALALMTGFDESTASPFGVMQAVQIRACAATALGDGPTAESAYAYLASHWREAPRAAIDALLCRDDVDGAAAMMVQRLDDPEMAAGALSELHQYLPTPDPTSFDARLNAGQAAMAARPEVIVARDRVGRTFRVPTLGGQF